jgi:hypothetical protein
MRVRLYIANVIKLDTFLLLEITNGAFVIPEKLMIQRRNL